MRKLNLILTLTLLVLLATLQAIQAAGRYNRYNGAGGNGRVSPDVETVFQWNLLEYGFPTQRDRNEAVANGNLIEDNGVPIDVQPYYSSNVVDNKRSRLFITIPRFQTGVPYSLAKVTRSESNGPLLMPYPNYSWHKSHGKNCDMITSAFRVAITECNQMWVIDSGVIGTVQHCAPQLLLFDLSTDQLVHRYRFNSSHYIPRASLFIAPIVDVRDPPPRGRCQQTMVYVADVNYHGLVVYNYNRNEAWRVENKFMYPDPNYGTHTIAGESFTLMDGIFGVTTDKRNLYYHPLASVGEYAVPLSLLDNSTNWALHAEGFVSEFKELGKRSSECGASAIDSHNNIYCVTLNPIKLLSWNVNSAYLSTNLQEIPVNTQLLEFVSGMKVVKSSLGKEELWMISNRFQKIGAGTQNPREVNFRILVLSLDDVQNGIVAAASDLHNRLVFS